MRQAVNHLRRYCPPSVYLADPSTITEAISFHISLNQIFQGCGVTEAQFLSGSILIFPTFYGSYSNGHWYLSILRRDDTQYKGYVLDSLGFSLERTTQISDVFSSRGISANWNYCDTILQCEVECGPRTITNICDIVDRLRQQQDLESILCSISSYHIQRREISTQSREWMHRAVINNLPSPYTFYFALIEDERAHEQRQPTKRLTTNTTIAPHTFKLLSKPMESNATQIIKKIASHHVLDDKDNKVYFIHKQGMSDNYVFPLHSNAINKLHKSDRKSINRYNSTTAARYLYCNDARLISVLDRMEKQIINEFYDYDNEKDLTLYLTRRNVQQNIDFIS